MEEAVLVPGVPARAGGSVTGGPLPPAGGAGLGRGSQEVLWGPMVSEGPGASPGGDVLVTEAQRVWRQEGGPLERVLVHQRGYGHLQPQEQEH